MSEPTRGGRATGRCMCEGLSFSIDGELRDVSDCHCWRCRRWTGHHMAATAARTEAVTIDDDETLRWYTFDDGASYGFCKRCGASAFWQHRELPGMISICAGLIDPPTGLRTTEVIYASTASDYHQLDPSVRSWPLDTE